MKASGEGLPFNVKNLTISKLGIRGDSRLSSIILTSREPNKLTVINGEGKRFLSIPAKYHRAKRVKAIFPNNAMEPPQMIKVCLIGKRKWDRLIVSSYASYDKENNRIAEFETCRLPVEVPNQLLSSWSTVMGLPAKYGFPLSLKRLERGRMIGEFRINEISCCSKCKNQRYEIPNGYKPAADEISLFFSNGRLLTPSDLDDLFGQIPSK